MTRTKGAKDLKKRKSRRDPKKKYMKRNGKFVPYVSKRNKNSPIKIWFWRRKPMSLDGFHKWNKNIRVKVKRRVTEFGIRLDVPTNMIDTKDKIEELCETHLYEGEWLMMGFSKGKNKFRTKPVKMCRIIIRDSPEGIKAKLRENYRLFRYWFWKG